MTDLCKHMLIPGYAGCTCGDVAGEQLPDETQEELRQSPRFRPRWKRNYWNCPHQQRRPLDADRDICAYCGEILPRGTARYGGSQTQNMEKK